MLKRVILHVGMPKTGTSFIQSHLAQNRTALRDRGIFYPATVSSYGHVYRTFESHHLLTYSLAGWEPFTLFDPGRFMDDSARACEKHGMHTMLLSAENAFWLPTPVVLPEDLEVAAYWEKKGEYIQRLGSFFKGFDTRVIVYLRRQDKWIESWFNQQIKNGFHLEGIMPFLRRHEPLLDYRRLLGIWADAFGRENMVVRPYEKSQLPDGLLADYAHQVGLFDAADVPLKRKPRSNAKLPPEVLRFMNECNAFSLPPARKRSLGLTIRKVANQFESVSVFEDQYFLKPVERLKLLEKVGEGNETIARDYMGRTDGVLFRDPLPDPAEPWRELPALEPERIFGFFGRIFAEDEFFRWDRNSRGDTPLAERFLTALEKHAPPVRRWLGRRLDGKLWEKVRFHE